MANNQIEDVEDIKKFDGINYKYDESLSNDNTFIFIKNKNQE